MMCYQSNRGHTIGAERKGSIWFTASSQKHWGLADKDAPADPEYRL